MINIGPTVPNSSKYKVSKALKAGQATTNNSEIEKRLPDHSQHLTSDRRSPPDRRGAEDQKRPLLELRSGRDRRRGTSQGRVDLTI